VFNVDKRSEQKANTYRKLIEQTTVLVQKNGFIQVSTKDIALACDVSQGTIFAHFPSKNDLLLQVLSSGIDEVRKGLTASLSSEMDPERFPRELIAVWMKHEGMLARVYMDHAYLPDSLKREVDELDTLTKNLIFDHLKQHWSTRINIIDSFLLIDAFLSQIKSYLGERAPLSAQSVLKQRQGRILKLYRMLFSSN
jgi:AcrR family transcriptional regulator